MTATRARVVHGEEAARGVPLLSPGLGAGQRRRVAREEIEARLTAERLVQEAHAEADAIVARAKEQAAVAANTALREAQAEADVKLTARWIALRQAESRRVGDDADRVLAIAVALAERLVGATLELDPTRVATLASLVLAEARGARRATIHAHPLDAEVLRAHFAASALDAQSVAIESDERLARGALRLHTDVGIIDAQLASRLDRLADALRDALR
jgi:flagellar biosynthesis/type III secretory pathway protein FliH